MKKSLAFVLAATALIAGVAAHYHHNAVNEKLTAIAKKKLELAQREQELHLSEFRVGKGSMGNIHEVVLAIREASLELAADKPSRVAAAKVAMEHFKQVHTLNEERFKAGTIKEQDMHRAHRWYLDAEAVMLREEAK